jgi:hypothetical protein
MKVSALAVASVLSSVLVGCGGGGGGGTPAASAPITPASTAEGVYAGTISNGKTHNTLVLENDQVYVMYGTTVNGGIMVSGFLQGNGKSNNGTFTASDMRDYSPSAGTSPNFSLSATYVKNTSFNGTTTDGTTTISFTGGPLQNSLYNYNTAANVANIVGTWSVTDLAGKPVVLNIGASGSFTGSTSGCTFSGTLKPRASGKNVFDAVATFGLAPCLLPGQTVSGIALEYPLAGGGRQLIIAGTDALRNNGAAFLGAR